VSKAANGAWTGEARSPDGWVLAIEPRETEGRALIATKHLADLDMMDAVEAVARGERH
jgi:hypothetical protein